MANVTTNFSDFSSIQTSFASIGGSFGLASGLTYARLAYDSASYYIGINAVAAYSVKNSTQLSGIFNNAAKDNFTFIGTNLLAFPNTATHMDYKFVASGVNVALDGAISTAYSGAGHSGYLNHIDVSSANYGEVTILGYVNVAIGSGTVSSVTRQINGASLTATGQLNASTYLGSDGNYHASITGTLTEMSLSSGGHTLQISGISVDVSGFSGFATVDALFNSVLSGDDTITGTAPAGASNILFGYGGNDTINGGVGIDTVIYSGPRTNFTITNSGANHTIIDNVSTATSDVLTNVERLQFSDTNIALDITGTAGQVYRLYNAAFHRAPDLGGLGFWIATSDNGMNLTSVSKEFINSAEFNQKYGSLDNSGFVTQLYANVLNRTPDKGGLDYWAGKINSSALTQEQVLIGFSESPENQTNVIGLIGNGIQYTHWG